MGNGNEIKITSISDSLYQKIIKSADEESKNLAQFCRDRINSTFNEKPNNNDEHPILQQIVTLMKIGGVFAVLLFIILVLFAGMIALNYWKQTGGI